MMSSITRIAQTLQNTLEGSHERGQVKSTSPWEYKNYAELEAYLKKCLISTPTAAQGLEV